MLSSRPLVCWSSLSPLFCYCAHLLLFLRFTFPVHSVPLSFHLISSFPLHALFFPTYLFSFTFYLFFFPSLPIPPFPPLSFCPSFHLFSSRHTSVPVIQHRTVSQQVYLSHSIAQCHTQCTCHTAPHSVTPSVPVIQHHSVTPNVPVIQHHTVSHPVYLSYSITVSHPVYLSSSTT